MPLPAKRNADASASAESPPDILPDDLIIRRVLDGERALFELIMRRYNKRLFRIARSIAGEDDEAEDIVQDAYVRAYQNLRQFEGRARFATWLTKIAVNEATARRRKRRRLTLVDADGDLQIDPMTIPSSNRDAPDAASQQELRAVLSRAADALPAELRVVFTMRIVEELDTEETAECLDISAANVKTRLHRARLQLRSWIDRQIGEESRQLYMFAGDRCDRIVAKVMSRLTGG